MDNPQPETDPLASSRTAATPAVAPRRVWRGFVVGLALLPLNCLWVLYAEAISARGPYFSTISLFYNVVFLLVLIALGNALVRRVRPALALNRSELIIIYVMLTISTSMAGHDMMQVLAGVMTWGWWYATPLNGGEYLLSRTVPRWLMVTDYEALYRFNNGNSTPYQWDVLSAWAGPILWHVGFGVVLVLVMVCLSVLLRPLWADRERLTFPVIQLPMELTNPETTLTRHHLLWVGFTLAAVLDVFNGISYLWPVVPGIPVYIDWSGSFADPPLKAVGWFPITFYPAVIGLAFLIPVDLLLSCTFFFFWWKAMAVLGAALGLTPPEGSSSPLAFPYAREQMFGGCLAIAAGPLVMGRRYFRQVWRRIRGQPSEADDTSEGMGYRLAAIGVAVGVALLAAVSVRAGLNPAVALAVFVIYYALAVSVGRVRAELGSPVHDFHMIGPDYAIPLVVGTGNLGLRALGAFHDLSWFNRAYRAHPMAGSLEGLQMAARARARARPLVWAILVATAAGMLAAFWVYLHYGYHLGASAQWAGGPGGFGWEAYARLGWWVDDRQPANLGALLAMAAGFGTVALLAAARAAFFGWPLHPVAFPLAASWSIHLVWGPMLIAGLAKLGVLRYGGLRSYRRVVPLFYGLILGESIVGCLWSLLGVVFGRPMYDVFHFM